MLFDCRYSIFLLERFYVVIKDEYDDSNPTSTITNSVERVVIDLYKHNIITNSDDKKLFYIDTDGRIDEIVYNKDKFINFKFGYDNLESFFNEFCRTVNEI